ncbi:MAG: class I SAM-dependent methyltransferase [Deltaproteobacteria bacterium]|nr:class I SAM-dependent methyltransferase [Deltaproteobacteria bacterium]
MEESCFYLMENEEEAIRLEMKTDPEAVKAQAQWCGVKPGLRVLDAGCGPGITTSILRNMIQPGGEIIGLDYSDKRIDYATKYYGNKPGIDFYFHDLREPIKEFGQFDLIWVRFVLEYHRIGSLDILKNLRDCLNPGGYLCLLDLDYNCLSHYGLPANIEIFLPKLMNELDEHFNFDTYAGRKLYSYLYDYGFEDIQLNLMAHHLIYGSNINDGDIFNWMKKVEMAAKWLGHLFEDYSGGHDAFFNEFKEFFMNPRRFTYTPLIIGTGRKPVSD